jgi:hypothetical protein
MFRNRQIGAESEGKAPPTSNQHAIFSMTYNVSENRTIQ